MVLNLYKNMGDVLFGYSFIVILLQKNKKDAGWGKIIFRNLVSPV